MKKSILFLTAVLTFNFQLLTFNCIAQEVNDSLAQSAVKYIDSIADKKITDDKMAQSTTIQQLQQTLREDSIAQSNAIQQKYQESHKKITEDSIAQSNAIQQKYQESHKKITEDSIAQSTEIQKKKQFNSSKTTKKSSPESNSDQQKYQQGGKKTVEDSIALNAIQQQYQLINKKLREDSIAQSIVIQQLYNKIAENASTQLPHPLIPSPIGEGAGGEVTFDAGQVFSTFKFIDSQGNKPKEFTHNRGFGFSLGYRYPLPNGLFIRTNIGLRKAGASMIYEGLNVNWNIQYADANIGLGYVYNKWRLKPYFSVSPYLGYMLKANQLIGAFNYDIKEIKSMKTTDFGLFFSPGFKVAVSKSIAFYAEYKYILGLQNLETATDKKSTNRGWAINLGVAISLSPSP